MCGLDPSFDSRRAAPWTGARSFYDRLCDFWLGKRGADERVNVAQCTSRAVAVTSAKHRGGRIGGMDKQQEFVLRTLEERDIRFVRLWFTDVLGFLKSVAIAPAELEGAFAEGIGFDGSSIEGFARVYESDMLAKPDPSTFQILPWRGERHGT